MTEAGATDNLSLLQYLKARKDRVLWELENRPSTRNSDLYLQWCYMRDFLNIPLPYLPFNWFVDHAGELETVRRVRQIIQNKDGLFLPTDADVVKRRRTRE